MEGSCDLQYNLCELHEYPFHNLTCPWTEYQTPCSLILIRIESCSQGLKSTESLREYMSLFS